MRGPSDIARGLNPRAWNGRRRRRRCSDGAARHTRRPPGELTCEPVPGRASLIRDLDRPRQPGAQPAAARISPFISKNRNSLVSASRIAATILLACTSRPKAHLAFAMVGSSNMGLWAAPRGQPHGETFPPRTPRGNRPLLPLRPGRTTIHMAYAKARHKRGSAGSLGARLPSTKSCMNQTAAPTNGQNSRRL